MARTHKPMVIEVTRGDLVESRHLVCAAIVHWDGSLLRSWGDASSLIFPRSALKPLQACAVVDRSSRDFTITEQELALACASHNGERVHVAIVLDWLKRLGLQPEDLECGAHEPVDQQDSRALIEQRINAGCQHNMCSGKHCGLLTLARVLRVNREGYIRYDHPVQSVLRRSLSRLLMYSLEDAPWAGDGCGIPTYAMPLTVLARAFAQLANASNVAMGWPLCSQRIVTAMICHPYLIAGRSRFETTAMASVPGRVIVKGGAEGVYAAGIIDVGLGIALKVSDGGRRAAEVAMGSLLTEAGVLNRSSRTEIGAYVSPQVQDVIGRAVGVVRCGSEEDDERTA